MMPTFKARAKNIPELSFYWDYTKMLDLGIAGDFCCQQKFQHSVLSLHTHKQLFKILSLKGLVCCREW